MASLTNTIKINYRMRDKDLEEDVTKEIRVIKTSTVYQRDRITMTAAQSGLTHSLAPTSGIGTLLVMPVDGDLGLKLNGSGIELGVAASGCVALITLGTGNNPEELVSLGLRNLAASATLDIDILHTD